MHCTLLVPDLFWTGDAAHAVRGLALGALETALARARAARDAPLPFEGWLCQAFEVERQQDWPVAPLTLPLDGGDPGDTYWLRADPVHLQLQRDRVALMASHTLDVTQQEADAIVAVLNGQFSGDGLQFEARAPRRWYVRAPQRPALVTEPMSAAAGRNVHDVLPTGTDATAWRHILNEIQMLMHDVPVNAARENAGQPVINSVWLWGGGGKTHVPGRPFAAVWSDDALSQALGARSDAHAAPLPADASAWRLAAQRVQGTSHLIVIDACAQAAAYGDLAGWRAAVTRLESNWVDPLLGALRKGAISTLVIAVPGSEATWRFELVRRDLYRFWTRRRPLSTYGAS